jgi:hypothetical protein
MQGTFAHLAARGSGSEAARRLCSALLRSTPPPRSVALPASAASRTSNSSGGGNAATRSFSAHAPSAAASQVASSAAQSEAVRALQAHNSSGRRGAVDAQLLATATAAAVLHALRDASIRASFTLIAEHYPARFNLHCFPLLLNLTTVIFRVHSSPNAGVLQIPLCGNLCLTRSLTRWRPLPIASTCFA